MFARLDGRPVLLLYGSADAYDLPAESLHLNIDAAIAGGVDVGSRICEGAGHDLVIDTCPTEWASWVGTFLADARQR